MSRKSLVVGMCFLKILGVGIPALAGPFKLSTQSGDLLVFAEVGTLAIECIEIAHEGLMLQPGGPPSHSDSRIHSLGPDGLGDAAFFDVFYDGLASEFPTHSTFDVLIEFTQPDATRQPRRHVATDVSGDPTIGFVTQMTTQLAGTPDYRHWFVGQTNPAQPGLSFRNLPTMRGNPGDLNFDESLDMLIELQFDGSGTIDPSLPLFRITLTGATVPEPSTLVLASVGVAAMLGVARKRRLRTL